MIVNDWSCKLVIMITISITEFKAKCLAILEEISRTGEGVTILKRGKPVAQVLPPTPRESSYPQLELQGTVEILGDIVGPVLPAHHWEAAEPEP